MNTITYEIKFFSYWHASSGLNGSTYADLLVNKDENKLPFIPGKTLKGLLRDAAVQLNELNLVEDDFIKEIFGIGTDKAPNKETEGVCFFSNAQLSKKLQENISEAESSYLYDVISSTKIDNKGQAVDNSLRQLEVTVPLTLYANIEHFPTDDAYKQQILYCMQYVKKLGLNRSRGLGRCQFTILNNH